MKKILIIGSFGRGNVGDDAFLHAAVKLFEGNEVYINSANNLLVPDELIGRVHTIATTGFGDFFHKLKVFLLVSHVVYCGGDLWVELYGDKMPRKSLYKMFILNIMLRLFGKKVAYIGCGAGNISGYSRILAKLSAMLASDVVVRDLRTKKLLSINKARVLPDLTVNLFEEKMITEDRVKSNIIGISVMYYIPSPIQNYGDYLQDIALLINNLAKQKEERRFVLIPMLISDDPHNDLKVCEELVIKIDPKYSNRVSIMKYDSLHKFLSQLQSFDCVIGTRLHANILSILSGTPAIGISYRPKVSSFFTEIGILENITSLDSIENIEQIVNKLYIKYDEEKQRVSDIRLKLIKHKIEYEKIVAQFIT